MSYYKGYLLLLYAITSIIASEKNIIVDYYIHRDCTMNEGHRDWVEFDIEANEDQLLNILIKIDTLSFYRKKEYLSDSIQFIVRGKYTFDADISRDLIFERVGTNTFEIKHSTGMCYEWVTQCKRLKKVQDQAYRNMVLYISNKERTWVLRGVPDESDK